MKKHLTIIFLLCLATICFTACKHEHTIVTDTAIVPTCAVEGKTEGSHCSVCGEVITAQEVVAKLEHTAVTDEAVEATCTAEGKTEGSHCSVCNEVITAQETVAKLEHTAVTDEAIVPTCTAEGKNEGSHCSVCGEIITAQETVAKLAHTLVTDRAVASTCAKTGLTEGTHCSVCGTVITAQQTVAKLAHTAVTDKAVNATCTSTGLTEGSHCSVCSTVIKKQDVVGKTQHNYQNGTCAVCGIKDNESGVEIAAPVEPSKPTLNLPTECYEMHILFGDIAYIDDMWQYMPGNENKYDITGWSPAKFIKDTKIFGIDGWAAFHTRIVSGKDTLEQAHLVMHSVTYDADTTPTIYRDIDELNQIGTKQYNEIMPALEKLFVALGDYTAIGDNTVDNFMEQVKGYTTYIQGEYRITKVYEQSPFLSVISNGLHITITCKYVGSNDNAHLGIVISSTFAQN